MELLESKKEKGTTKSGESQQLKSSSKSNDSFSANYIQQSNGSGQCEDEDKMSQGDAKLINGVNGGTNYDNSVNGGTGYDNGVKSVTGTIYLMDEVTPQGKGK